MNPMQRKTLEQVVDEYGRYPLEAFEFVRHGLTHTVEQIYGQSKANSDAACHVSGQQLCKGLRDFAIQRYGVMARTVLAHWGIHRTIDFGRIVFAMIDSKLMHKNEHDDIRDFEAAFDFEEAFKAPERMEMKPRTPTFSL
ncbi:MAG TPA: Minf_1886 family protein [Phycisphaerae bacterium]|jgi:uncharacterized repeat protein (TIGR04138 family)|nr:Minf_1886 family protein [Phycisphaerae bacterium]